jgi:hypothetical protein
VADRIVQLTVPLVPRARSLVYDAYHFGLLLSQPGLEDIREQLVIAIPLPLVVERNDDQFAGRVERLTRSALTCHRRPARPVSYEDVLDFLGLLLAKYWPVTPSTCADEAR